MFSRERDSKVINLPSIETRFPVTDNTHVCDNAKSREKILKLQLTGLQKKGERENKMQKIRYIWTNGYNSPNYSLDV